MQIFEKILTAISDLLNLRCQRDEFQSIITSLNLSLSYNVPQLLQLQRFLHQNLDNITASLDQTTQTGKLMELK
jgi:hypothetical protein